MGYLYYDILYEMSTSRQTDSLSHHFLGLGEKPVWVRVRVRVRIIVRDRVRIIVRDRVWISVRVRISVTLNLYYIGCVHHFLGLG
jgi:hypothetical protein